MDGKDIEVKNKNKIKAAGLDNGENEDMTKNTYSDHFKLEHILVLALPFYMVLTRRYVVIPLSLDMALFSFFLYAAYHSPVLHVSSLLSGLNLNYALVPPACKL